jgi:hypothetical protein
MSDRYYPVVYPPRAEGGCDSLLRMALLGAVVGGAAAVLLLTSRAQQRVAPTEGAPGAHVQRTTTGDK